MTYTLRPKPPSPFRPKFHLFSKLPPELRIKIWKLIKLPRTIHLKLQYQHATRRLYWAVKASRPLSLLAINRESHSEVLKKYEHPFHKGFMIPLQPCKGSRSLDDLYFNWFNDMIDIEIPKCLESIYHYCQPCLTFKKLIHSFFTKSAVSKCRIHNLSIDDTVLALVFVAPSGSYRRKYKMWDDEVLEQVQELVVVVTERYGYRLSLSSCTEE
jgi:2EXR family